MSEVEVNAWLELRRRKLASLSRVPNATDTTISIDDYECLVELVAVSEALLSQYSSRDLDGADETYEPERRIRRAIDALVGEP